MNAPHKSAQAPAWRKRTAAVFAAVGALVFSSGIVMLSAPAANAATIAICHANNSPTNPYIPATVDDSSTDASEGHYAHADDSGFDWGNKGAWWNGQWYPPNSERPDLIPGVTLPAGTVVTDAFCNAPVTVGPIAVTPSVQFVDPDCGVAASWSGSNIQAITYTPSGPAAPGAHITVTAAPKAGYEFTKNAPASFPHTFGPAPVCQTVGVVDPIVTQPACTGPGTSSALAVVLADGPAGVSYGYNTATRVVTATVTDPAKKFAAVIDTDWTRIDDTHATYQVSLLPAGDCLVAVRAAAPTATGNSCTAPGNLVLPDAAGDGYHWTGQTTDGAGDHVVTAVAETGHVMTGQTQWTVHVKAAGEGLTTCGDPATEVTPLEPQWTEANCTAGPDVSYRAVEGVEYATTGTVAPGNTVSVTASAVGNHVLAAGAVHSWSHLFHAKPTGTACGENPGTPNPGTPNPGTPTPGTPNPQPTLVSPNYPSTTEADCSHRGQLVVPTQPAGVVMTQTGSVPGDVTFTFAPAAGYAFPAGTDTEVTVTVDKKLSGEDCILGEETTSPKPHTTKPKPKPRDRAPIVLGTQAAVPTAVDAGLAGLPSTSVSPISSPQLAQALVAGGLLLLIAGGSMGLGRRTRGAHES